MKEKLGSANRKTEKLSGSKIFHYYRHHNMNSIRETSFVLDTTGVKVRDLVHFIKEKLEKEGLEKVGLLSGCIRFHIFLNPKCTRCKYHKDDSCLIEVKTDRNNRIEDSFQTLKMFHLDKRYCCPIKYQPRAEQDDSGIT